MAAQQQNRITFGNAALRVRIKIYKTAEVRSSSYSFTCLGDLEAAKKGSLRYIS